MTGALPFDSLGRGEDTPTSGRPPVCFAAKQTSVGAKSGAS